MRFSLACSWLSLACLALYLTHAKCQDQRKRKHGKAHKQGKFGCEGACNYRSEYDCDRGTWNERRADISAKGGAQALESVNVFGESWPKKYFCIRRVHFDHDNSHERLWQPRQKNRAEFVLNSRRWKSQRILIKSMEFFRSAGLSGQPDIYCRLHFLVLDFCPQLCLVSFLIRVELSKLLLCPLHCRETRAEFQSEVSETPIRPKQE